MYNFVCESVPSDALEDIKTQISVGTAMGVAGDVIDELFVGRVSASSAPATAKQQYLCKGVDCRFSYEYIGEKVDVVGYCLWCDSEKMLEAMENRFTRNYCHVKKRVTAFL